MLSQCRNVDAAELVSALYTPALILPSHSVSAAVSIVCVLGFGSPLCARPVSSCLLQVAGSVAILKVRDDSEGGVSHQPLMPPPPLSLRFHVLSFLSWYVDFIKFSSGWVIEKTGGDQGSHPFLAAFICPRLFHSGAGTRVWRALAAPFSGTGIGDGSLISSGGQSGRADKKSLNLQTSHFQ